jgi:hypothetical protein
VFLQGDLRGAAIGKKFESANLVDDAFAGRGTHLVAEMIGDDKRARRGFQLRHGFQHTYGAAPTGNAGRGEESRRGAADNDDFAAAAISLREGFLVGHDSARSKYARSPDNRSIQDPTLKKCSASRPTRVG